MSEKSNTGPGLTPGEARRYQRHIVLKGLGAPGQNRLKRARVLVVGAGGLGSPLLAYLAAAGVGEIGIADPDSVALSNLQRQIIHTEQGIGHNKAESAANFASHLNSDVSVTPHPVAVTTGNGLALMRRYDIIADGTDTFTARAEIATLAEQAQKPLVAGAVSMFDGQVTVLAPYLFGADNKPLPRFGDLYPDTPDPDTLPSCEAVGVLGALTGVIGTLMAMEVIKLITGLGEPLLGRLLIYDGRDTRFTEMTYRRR